MLGWHAYDASGPQFGVNLTFVNFTTNNYRPAGAISNLPNGKNMLFPADILSDLKFDTTSTRYYIPNFPADWYKEQNADGMRGLNLRDGDGTLTGNIDGWLIGMNGSWMLPANHNCQLRAASNAYVCPSFDNNFVYLFVENTDTGSTDFKGTNADLKTPFYRATWYKFGTTFGSTNPADSMPITGGDTSGATRSYYTANVLARSGYALSFPHPTPPSFDVYIHSAAKGEYVYLALPYPNPPGLTQNTVCGANNQANGFTITKGYDKRVMRCVSNIGQVDATSYFYDFTRSALILRVEEEFESINTLGLSNLNTGLSGIRPTPTIGFGYHNSYDSRVSVRANFCSGSSCALATPTSFVIPPAYSVNEDTYVATLTPCHTVGFDNTYQGSGRAIFTYNPASKQLAYHITSNAGGALTNITLSRLVSASANPTTVATGSEPRELLFNLSQLYTPARGAIQLNYQQHAWLYSGDLIITLHTAAHPAGVLSGRIGCKSGVTCSAPAPLVGNNCPAIDGSDISNYLPVYNGSNARSLSSWSWGAAQTSVNFADVGDGSWGDIGTALKCAPASISVSMNRSSGFQIHFSRPVLVDVTKYSHFDFFVRLDRTPVAAWLGLDLKLTVAFTTGNGAASLSIVTVESDALNRYALSNAWTRVRVPLSSLGFTAAQNTPAGAVTEVRFLFFQDWRLPPGTTLRLFFSAIGFSSPAALASDANNAVRYTRPMYSEQSNAATTCSATSLIFNENVQRVTPSSSSSSTGTNPSTPSSSTGGSNPSTPSSSTGGSNPSTPSSSTGSNPSRPSSSTGSAPQPTPSSSTGTTPPVASSSTASIPAGPSSSSSSSSTGANPAGIGKEVRVIEIKLKTDVMNVGETWKAGFLAEISTYLKIHASRVKILSVRAGSAIVSFALLSPEAAGVSEPSAPTASAAAATFVRDYNDPGSPLFARVPSLAAVADTSAPASAATATQCADGSYQATCGSNISGDSGPAGGGSGGSGGGGFFDGKGIGIVVGVVVGGLLLLVVVALVLKRRAANAAANKSLHAPVGPGNFTNLATPSSRQEGQEMANWQANPLTRV